MESKEEKYDKIIQTAFGLSGRHGVENISISMLARESGVSRGWIYKYIASDIEGVLQFCLKAYADEFARFADLREHESPEELKSSLLSFSEALADRVAQDSLVLEIYFGNISSQNLIGRVVREADERYLQHLSANISRSYKCDKEIALSKARLFHSMRMGGLLLFDESDQSLKKDYLKSLSSILDGLFA